MGFQLVPKSMTINDLERRNGFLFCVITLKAVDFVHLLIRRWHERIRFRGGRDVWSSSIPRSIKSNRPRRQL